MIRALLTTTALTALLTTGAFAEDPAAKPTNDTTGAAAVSTDTNATTASGDKYFQAMEGQILASSVMGATVYTGTGDDAEAIGDVNDVVMSPEGSVEAIVLGVGGFLGVGEKEIALNFDRISWSERDGERYLTADATKDEMEAAPEFDRSVFEPEQPEMQTSMADQSGTGMATDTTGGASQEPVVGSAPGAATDQPDLGNSDTTNTAAADSAGDTMTHESSEDQMAADTTASDSAATSADTMASDTSGSDEAMSTDTAANEDNAASNEQMAANAVDPSILSAEEMIGTAVYGANDSDLGEVNDVIVSPEGELVAYIIDVGGFLGLGEKPVALDATKLDVTKDENGDMQIRTSLTEEELKSYPTYSEEAYKANPDAVLVR